MNISSLVKKYSDGLGEYQNQKYNETQLRNDFLDPFFELLGWDIRNIASKPTNEREVLVEEGLKVDVTSNTKKPDYTFRLFAERKFFTEAKKPSIKIESNAAAAKQVRRYGFTANLKISVLTNFEHLVIYDCSYKVLKSDTFQKGIIKTYNYLEYEEKFAEILRLIGRESVYTGSFDKEWEFIENKTDRVTVDDLFVSQINDWRISIGKEIFKYQPAIDTHTLNDQVQSYINRIVFLRVCEDRNLEDYKTLLNFADTQDFSALINKFQEADKKYNSGLFDQLLSKEIIGNISSVFWVIIKQLYYPESPYSFSVLSSDILGKIYEIFLTEQLHIKNGEILLEKKPDNVDKDIVTTPIHIIQDINRETIIPYFKNKTYDEFLLIKIADIACGSGSFLLEAFQLLNDLLIDYFLNTDRNALIQVGIANYKLPFEFKKQLLINCIHGIDKDYNAVEAAKFGLLLKLLEGENTNSTNFQHPILPDLDNNIHFGNSLISPSELEELGFSEAVFERINPFDFSNTNFDVIIGNPPYMKSGDMKNITPEEYKIYHKIYDASHKQFDKYFLFIERTLRVLKENGVYGYILPIKFAKVGAGVKLRELLTTSGSLGKIVSFGANQIFKNKSTYTCLLFGRKANNENFEYYEVKSLSAWKARTYRAEDFESINISSLDNDVWVLVSKELKPVVSNILEQSITLEALVVDSDFVSNGIQTSANKVYIFQPTMEDNDFYYFEKNTIEYKIEKELTRPYYQTTRGGDNLYTYRPFAPNRRVIYPYKLVGEKIEFIPLKELIQHYPNLYNYLYKNKERLKKRDIKPTPETEEEWYRYGRHQALERCEVAAKIIVGVLAIGNKYAIDYQQTLISSGGTAGYCMIVLPNNSPYSLYYIQAILNSKYLEWYSSLLGEVFGGGYIARGTKTLKRLPIRVINFEDAIDKKRHDNIAIVQEELIDRFQSMENAFQEGDKRLYKTKKTAFERLLNKQESVIKELYNLGENDDLIPSIQELYATN